MAHRNVYDIKDCDVVIYFDATTPGIAPDGETKTWADDGESVFAVGTGFKFGTKKDASLVHGGSDAEAVGTRVGKVTREWSFDSLYTNDMYGGNTMKLRQFADGDVGMFAMQITTGAAADAEYDAPVFTYCTCTDAQVTAGGDGLTISMSGICEMIT